MGHERYERQPETQAQGDQSHRNRTRAQNILPDAIIPDPTPAVPITPSLHSSLYASTKGHRNGQRGNLGLEVVGQALAAINPATEIPFKISQACLSIYSMFGAKLPEKIVHGVQVGLSTAQAALYIVMLYKGNTCDSGADDTECITSTVLTLIYAGLLAASTVMAETSKEPFAPVVEAAEEPPLVASHV